MERVRRVVCPDCGLEMEIKPGPEGSTLSYDVSDWRRRCERIEQGSPAWCLVERDGTSPKKD
jgi:hypothetical protein